MMSTMKWSSERTCYMGIRLLLCLLHRTVTQSSQHVLRHWSRAYPFVTAHFSRTTTETEPNRRVPPPAHRPLSGTPSSRTDFSQP